MIKVIKIGGNVIDDPEALSAFISDFASIEGRKILVHGGGKEATRLSEKLGIPTTMINGRRVTTKDTLDVVTMVYAGLINKRVVSMLQGAGCNAIGLTGADGCVIKATRRNPHPVDFGYVGDIDPADISGSMLVSVLDSGITPVMCAIAYDGESGLLNCNADTIASSVAVAVSSLEPVELIFCFEQLGVMENIDDPDSVIAHITPSVYSDLRARGVVSKGMIPKLDNAFEAVSQGVRSVMIKHSRNLTRPVGTVITA